MGFPAEGMESAYRNPMSEVKRFLNKFHPERYRVYNLCCEGRYQYDEAHFEGRVAHYPFSDHQAPDLTQIQAFCMDAEKWLNVHAEHVVVVHCKAGKGRTGVMICCLLLHLGLHSTAADALDFYAKQRTRDNKGVTIPSQRRYVEYYAAILQHELLVAHGVRLNRLRASPVPKMSGPLVVEVLLNGDVIHVSAPGIETPQHHGHMDFVLPALRIHGNMRIRLLAGSGAKEICRLWLHSDFLKQPATLKLERSEIDQVHKDKKYSVFAADFAIQLMYSSDDSAVSTPPVQVAAGMTDTSLDHRDVPAAAAAPGRSLRAVPSVMFSAPSAPVHFDDAVSVVSATTSEFSTAERDRLTPPKRQDTFHSVPSTVRPSSMIRSYSSRGYVLRQTGESEVSEVQSEHQGRKYTEPTAPVETPYAGPPSVLGHSEAAQFDGLTLLYRGMTKPDPPRPRPLLALGARPTFDVRSTNSAGQTPPQISVSPVRSSSMDWLRSSNELEAPTTAPRRRAPPPPTTRAAVVVAAPTSMPPPARPTAPAPSASPSRSWSDVRAVLPAESFSSVPTAPLLCEQANPGDYVALSANRFGTERSKYSLPPPPPPSGATRATVVMSAPPLQTSHTGTMLLSASPNTTSRVPRTFTRSTEDTASIQYVGHPAPRAPRVSTSSARSAVLHWDLPIGDGPYSAFHVFRARSPLPTVTHRDELIYSGAGCSCFDTTVQNAAQYAYAVAAKGMHGWSVLSEPVMYLHRS
eukprot:TRINITY_DN1211_c0_g1_i2.p1 TRINITY_DN1211_c0_g1~~TRINITY_DN1211_c0_g1_i2.p1  ORF type:complete len:746 (+),score=117.78 TRINITY_DN1211_c0_g1_i2:850-3087(+)